MKIFIRYLRWVHRQHWTLRAMTLVLVAPVALVVPAARWNEMIDEAFRGLTAWSPSEKK